MAAAASASAAASDAASPPLKHQSIIAALINTPNTSCLNLTEYHEEGNSPGSHAWDYLACTEIVHPIGANNITDMFPPFNWTLQSTIDQCNGMFGPPNWHVTPRARWIPDSFGVSAHWRNLPLRQ
jgi:hypothetical protein